MSSKKEKLYAQCLLEKPNKLVPGEVWTTVAWIPIEHKGKKIKVGSQVGLKGQEDIIWTVKTMSSNYVTADLLKKKDVGRKHISRSVKT